MWRRTWPPVDTADSATRRWCPWTRLRSRPPAAAAVLIHVPTALPRVVRSSVEPSPGPPLVTTSVGGGESGGLGGVAFHLARLTGGSGSGAIVLSYGTLVRPTGRAQVAAAAVLYLYDEGVQHYLERLLHQHLFSNSKHRLGLVTFIIS